TVGVFDPLDIQSNGPGGFILPQILDTVDDVYVRLVPHADGLAHHNAVLMQIRDHLCDIRTALGCKDELSVIVLNGTYRDVQRQMGVYYPEAVGAKKTDAVAFCFFYQNLLKGPALI